MTGFNNVPLADIFEPGLITVAQPMTQLRAPAAEMLPALLNGEWPAPRILPHQLVLRQSA